jgi:hypothetical protein
MYRRCVCVCVCDRRCSLELYAHLSSLACSIIRNLLKTVRLEFMSTNYDCFTIVKNSTTYEIRDYDMLIQLKERVDTRRRSDPTPAVYVTVLSKERWEQYYDELTHAIKETFKNANRTSRNIMLSRTEFSKSNGTSLPALQQRLSLTCMRDTNPVYACFR